MVYHRSFVCKLCCSFCWPCLCRNITIRDQVNSILFITLNSCIPSSIHKTKTKRHATWFYKKSQSRFKVFCPFVFLEYVASVFIQVWN
uniref:Uncharacterized protein n=1 Tax=Oryza nivara TaxID=4536 RepID=A0A0E0GB17_ORYNI